MNWEAIGAVGEVVGAIAVVATLGYLAVQLKQNTRTVQLAAETGLSEKFADWTAHVVNNPELGRIWDAAAIEPESLTDDEKRLYLWYVAELILLYEGQFRLFAEGLITEGSWKPKTNFILVLLKSPWVTMWWDSRIAPFSDEFFFYIEELRRTSKLPEEDKNVLRTITRSSY